uniref:Uncharacterized protein n=1 Tax=Arundo donax TaxID=35708 RepID=A0A0A8Z4S8_ARUDO
MFISLFFHIPGEFLDIPGEVISLRDYMIGSYVVLVCNTSRGLL